MWSAVSEAHLEHALAERVRDRHARALHELRELDLWHYITVHYITVHYMWNARALHELRELDLWRPGRMKNQAQNGWRRRSHQSERETKTREIARARVMARLAPRRWGRAERRRHRPGAAAPPTKARAAPKKKQPRAAAARAAAARASTDRHGGSRWRVCRIRGLGSSPRGSHRHRHTRQHVDRVGTWRCSVYYSTLHCIPFHYMHTSTGRGPGAALSITVHYIAFHSITCTSTGDLALLCLLQHITMHSIPFQDMHTSTGRAGTWSCLACQPPWPTSHSRRSRSARDGYFLVVKGPDPYATRHHYRTSR